MIEYRHTNTAAMAGDDLLAMFKDSQSRDKHAEAMALLASEIN